MERRLATILAADAVGYSRLMEADEEATVGALDACRQIIDRLVDSRAWLAAALRSAYARWITTKRRTNQGGQTAMQSIHSGTGRGKGTGRAWGPPRL